MLHEEALPETGDGLSRVSTATIWVRAGLLLLVTILGVEPSYCDEPTLDVTPSEVTTRTLLQAAPIEIDVRLKAGDVELSRISLSTFSNDGIVAELVSDTPAVLPKLPPKSSHFWRLKLTRPIGSVLTDSILHIRVEFDAEATAKGPGTGGSEGNRPSGSAPAAGSPAGSAATDGVRSTNPAEFIHQIIYATEKIKPSPAVAGVELARAEIKGLPESLAHERPGRMFVVVTNQYQHPLNVKDIKPLGPTYVELLQPDKGTRLPLRIEPGQTEAVVYDIKPRSQVVPGKYSFIAEVDVESDDHLTAAVLTPAQEINVVVLGESDLFKFLGTPSLLFLPGVLMLITWQFLTLWGKSGDDAKKYKPQWNTSDFWVIAVALSLLTALVYPLLTGLFLNTARDFVSAYGLADYAFIFAFSLVGSIAVFAAKLGIEAALKAHRDRKLAETVPGIDDTPLQILEKLVKQKAKADNLFQQYAAGENAARLLCLEPWSLGGVLWLVPQAEINVVDQTNAEAVDQRDKLVNGPPPDAGAVLTKLKEGVQRNWWGNPLWRPAGDVRHPVKVESTNWSKSGAAVPFLRGD
jgi:hypothetical protein